MMKNKHAQALAKLSHMKPSEKRADAARENGKKGGRPVTWEKAPKRGSKNPKAEIFRYTVVRLEDRAERFTNRRPHYRDDQMIWDNVRNCEVRPKTVHVVIRSRNMGKRAALAVPLGQFCTPDDHLRYAAIRGKCMKCGRALEL